MTKRPDRLYGGKDDEHLTDDEEEAAESLFEDWLPPLDATFPYTKAVEVCEYTVLPPGDFGGDRLPTAAELIESIVDRLDDLTFEELHDAIERAGHESEVQAAFAAALELWASRIKFSIADRQVGSRWWQATIPADGEDWSTPQPTTQQGSTP